MARKSKYTPELVSQIVQLLEDGNTDTDTCSLVGISKETFYNWLQDKAEFIDAVSRARGIARQRAVDAWRQAMDESSTKSAKTVVFTETRLNKNGEPYTYTRTTTEKQVTENAPDWRAAESYLKRRDPANWAETFIIKVTPEQKQVLDRFGKSASEAFEELINNLAEAERLKND
jgi:AcrR family transcriptional regulator